MRLGFNLICDREIEEFFFFIINRSDCSSLKWNGMDLLICSAIKISKFQLYSLLTSTFISLEVKGENNMNVSAMCGM